MWVAGSWQDILLLGFEITDEPSMDNPHAPEVQHMLQDYFIAARKGNLKKAEELISQALAMEPDRPELRNNLAAIYEATGRRDAALAIWHDIFNRHPDYLFSRTALARNAALQGNTKAAGELLQPLMERKRFHVSEYAAFCQAQMEIGIAEGNRKAAQRWLDMLEKTRPNDRSLGHYRRRIGKLS